MPRKVNIDEVLSRFKEVHGEKYDYSKVVYKKMHSNVSIVCPIHGEFLQTPHSHLAGQGCPKCGIDSRAEKRRDTTESFIKKARLVHGDKYDYSKVVYVGSQDGVTITCPIHGEFQMRPNSHLMGEGCRRCKNEKLSKIFSDSTEVFIKKAKSVYGDKYDYSLVEYNGSYIPVNIICKKHGVFAAVPNGFLQGHGCPTCGHESSHHLKYDNEKFVSAARKVHGDKYDYSNLEYSGIFSQVKVICPKHGEFSQRAVDHLSGCGCSKCGSNSSKFENEVYEFVHQLCNDAVEHDRQILDNMEIDVFVPSKSIGIECDGLFWHSEVKKKNTYHMMKTKKCSEKGVRLIHIFEDEWTYKKDIVKSRLKNLFGASEKKIYARNCELKKVESSEANDFLSANHIQGKVYSNFNYGLYYDGCLVSLMTFGKRRINLGSRNVDGCFELLRFCNINDTVVVGGASKMLKKFIEDEKPKEITSYCDLRWSNGSLYEKIGFTLDHISKPNYFYIINDRRENRFKYRKDILIKEGYDPNKTEHDIMLERNIYRIYDCGCNVYKMVLGE